MKKTLKRMLIIILIVIVAFVAGVYIFMQQPLFGHVPTGARLERIKKSPHYRDDKFQNLNPTPDLAEGVSYYKVMKEFIFNKSDRIQPEGVLPSKKTDLLKLNPDENILVWFGHSSYFIQVDGKKMLVDPVFSGAASPVKFTNRSYKGSDVYSADELPEIDYLFISHDHWDHLDYETVVAIKSKVKKVICGLGVGEHLELWGYNKNNIIEKDWNEEAVLDSGFTVAITPGRHFSGRAFRRQPSLWVSFALTTPSMKIFMGGDSGYDTHFAEIGKKYGPFDLAILECGQYNKNWKYIHMMPDEVIRAALDLKAKKLFPVHWGKFTLAQHAWDEPINTLVEENKTVNIPLITPMIGEEVNLKESKVFTAWWKGVK